MVVNAVVNVMNQVDYRNVKLDRDTRYFTGDIFNE